jgi:hypothetical protein
MGTYSGYQHTKPAVVKIEHEIIETTVAESTTTMAFFKIDALQKFTFIENGIVGIKDIVDVVDGADEYGAGTYTYGAEVKVSTAKLKFKCAQTITIAAKDVEKYHPMNTSSPELSVWEEIGAIDEYAPRDRDPESRLSLSNTEGLIVKVTQESFEVNSTVSKEGVLLPTAIALAGVNAYRAMVVKVVDGIVDDAFEVDMSTRTKLYIQSELPEWGAPDTEWYVWLFPAAIPSGDIVNSVFEILDNISSQYLVITDISASNDDQTIAVVENGYTLRIWVKNISGIYEQVPYGYSTRHIRDPSLSADGSICVVCCSYDTNTTVAVFFIDHVAGTVTEQYSKTENFPNTIIHGCVNSSGTVLAVLWESDTVWKILLYSIPSGALILEKTVSFRGRYLCFCGDDVLVVGASTENIGYTSQAGRVYLLDAETLDVTDTIHKDAYLPGEYFGISVASDHTAMRIFIGTATQEIIHVYDISGEEVVPYGGFITPDNYVGLGVSHSSGGEKIWTYGKYVYPYIRSYVRDTSFSGFVPDVGQSYSSWLAFFGDFIGVPTNSLLETRNVRLGLVAAGKARELDGSTKLDLSIDTVPTRENYTQFGITTFETIDIFETFTATVLFSTIQSLIAAKYTIDTSLVNDVIIHPGTPTDAGENWIVGKVSSASKLEDQTYNSMQILGTSLPQEIYDRVIPRKTITKGWY